MCREHLLTGGEGLLVPTSSQDYYKPPEMLEELLLQIKGQSEAGQGSTQKHHVYVHGAPGMGKTALAQAVYRHCTKVCTVLACYLFVVHCVHCMDTS